MAYAMLLIDADLLLHRTTAVTERDIDWGDSVSTIHCDHNEMRTLAKRELEKIQDGVGLPHTRFTLVFSGEGNFRKQLYPDYKGNRQGRKPVGFAVLKRWLLDTYPHKMLNGVEADDLLAIMQTSGKYPKSVIVSDDKDLLQVPGLLYRPKAGETHEISVSNGYRHHMYQTLVGDPADNYPGLPGCGPKTAEKILDCPESDWWTAVATAYVDKGLSEEEAILQARVAKILQFKDYDFKQRKPLLWLPPSSASGAASTSTVPATQATKPNAASTQAKTRSSKSTREPGKTSTSPKTRSTSSTTQSTPSTTPSTPSSPSSSSSGTTCPTQSATSSSTSCGTKTRTGSKTSRKRNSTSTF